VAFKIKNKEFEGLMKSQGVNRLFNQTLPARLSYPLAMLMKVVQSAFDTFLQQKLVIIEKYCDRDEKNEPIRGEKGEYFFTKDNNAKEFTEEHKEFLDLETKIKEDRLPVDLKALDEIGVELSPLDLMSLGLLIEFKGPEDKKKKVVPIKEKKKEGSGKG